MSENSGTNTSHEPQQSKPQHEPLSERERLYHLTYGLGISVLFSAADVAFLWPESHSGALIFVAAVLSIVSLYELTVVFPSPRWVRGFVTMFVWGLAWAIWETVGSILPTENDHHGWLLPANEPTPPNQCTSMKGGEDDPVLIVGGVAFPILLTQTQFTAVQVGKCPVLSMQMGPDGLIIAADDHDSDGNLLFRIDGKNEFHRSEPHTFSMSRSEDRSTLTVTGEKGDELLMVKFANPKAIIVRGTFGCKGHPDVEITEDSITSGGTKVGMSRVCLEYPFAGGPVLSVQ